MHVLAGFVQSHPAFGNKQASFDMVKKLAKGITVDLLVLPELFATGYAFTSRDEAASLAEGIDGETFEFLVQLSKTTGAAVAGGFVERDGDALFNAAMLVHGDALVGTYRKLHLFYKETAWFTPGDRPPRTWSLPVRDTASDTSEGMDVSVGMMICFDWLFPEVARSLALAGADVILHPANLVLPYCQAAMITRCLENRVFAITANRVGTEARGDDAFTFTGGSQVVSPAGVVLQRATTGEPCVGLVSIDLGLARDKHVTPCNDIFAGRRPDMYR